MSRCLALSAKCAFLPAVMSAFSGDTLPSRWSVLPSLVVVLWSPGRCLLTPVLPLSKALTLSTAISSRVNVFRNLRPNADKSPPLRPLHPPQKHRITLATSKFEHFSRRPAVFKLLLGQYDTWRPLVSLWRHRYVTRARYVVNSRQACTISRDILYLETFLMNFGIEVIKLVNVFPLSKEINVFWNHIRHF